MPSLDGTRTLRGRLSLLMFLQYAVPGSLLPLFSLRLQELGLTPLEIGWACATQALASLVGPLVAGQAADRWFPAEHCLSLCALAAGILLWILAVQTTAAAVFVTSLAFWLAMGPAMTLGVALSFAHLHSPERHFGQVRLWGTIGWVVPGLLLGYWFSDPAWLVEVFGLFRPGQPQSELSDAFRLGSLLAFVLSGYALTLPHTPPQRRSGPWLAPLAALGLLRRRSFAVYCACTLALCVTVPFSTQVTPLLLEHLGVSRPWLSPTLTLGQSMEVVSLAVLPMLLLRLGTRGTMLLGLLAWWLALTILTVGRPAGLVIGSLALNGLCISCFIVAGQVFVNRQAQGDIRASAQALLSFTNAVGLLTGNVLVGWVRRQAHGQFGPTFAVGAAIAGILMIAFFVGFSNDELPSAPKA